MVKNRKLGVAWRPDGLLRQNLRCLFTHTHTHSKAPLPRGFQCGTHAYSAPKTTCFRCRKIRMKSCYLFLRKFHVDFSARKAQILVQKNPPWEQGLKLQLVHNSYLDTLDT